MTIRNLMLTGLLCAALVGAEPIRRTAEPSRQATTIVLIPLGDAALCAAGYQMPDCTLLPYLPQYWLQVVKIDGVVVSETIVVGSHAPQ